MQTKKHIKLVNCFLYCVALFIYTQFNFLHSQGQNNYWYFGNNYGLNFPGSGAPVYISNCMVAADEGSSVISDAAGNLLFYTDGILVWDKNHTQMPNGFGLGAWYQTSSTQCSIIIQKPGSPNLYYIFCVDAGGQSNGLRYSIVDMTLNSGLGDVLTGFKNIPIHTPTTEKIAAVKHCNGVDVWIVTHDENSNQFRSVLLTSSGLNAPVISATGTTYSISTSNAFESGVGTMKISPDGKKLAICESFHPKTLELFDFNNTTGQVSNPINLLNPTILGTYGLEFSSNSTKLYAGTTISAPGQSGKIYQWDLCNTTPASIQSSSVEIGSYFNGSVFQLQLGPDNKIYVASAKHTHLFVINNPNVAGTACNFNLNGVYIGGNLSRLGLPSCLYIKPPPPPFTHSVSCLTASFTPPTLTVSTCSGTLNPVTAYSWNFGDPSSGPTNVSTNNSPVHSFSSPGTFTTTLILYYACGQDTIKGVVTLSSHSVIVNSNPANCTSPGSATVTVNGGNGPFTYNWISNSSNTTVANGFSQGTHSVIVTGLNGCSNTASFSVGLITTLITTTSATNILCNAGANGKASVSVNGGAGSYNYIWSNGGTSNQINNLIAGVYNVTITNGPCTTTANVQVTEPSALTIQINSNPVNACAGSAISLNANATGGTGSTYSYSWANGPTSSINFVTQNIPGNYVYTVSATDVNNCTISKTVSLTFNNIPIINASSQSVCVGDKININVTGATDYTWMPGNFNGNTYTTIAANNLTFTITGKDAISGCVSLPITYSVIVNQPPVHIVTPTKKSGCAPLCLTFTSSANAGDIKNIAWNFSNGNSYSNNTNVIETCFNNAGAYIIEAILTGNNGCSAIATTSINVFTKPVADFYYTPNKIIVNNAEVIFTDASYGEEIEKWDWFFMSKPNSYSSVQNPNFVYTDAGKYSVALLVTSKNGCSDTITKIIDVAEDYSIYVPNTFTPNGDGINDLFMPKGFGIINYEMQVFDRWGEKMFSTNDFTKGWDGTYQNRSSEQVQDGTYVWRIVLTNALGKSHELTGSITLLK